MVRKQQANGGCLSPLAHVAVFYVYPMQNTALFSHVRLYAKHM